MNTKILTLIGALLCLIFHTGCGTFHRHDAEKNLETQYTTQVAFENSFSLRVYSDSVPGMTEGIYFGNASGRSVGFWHDFEEYQVKYGRQRALAELVKIVKGNGLCMAMASDYGQRLIGETAFSQVVKLGGDQQTRFYRFATAENDFNIGPYFLKVKK